MQKISEGKNKKIHWKFSKCIKDESPIIDESIKLIPNHFGRVRVGTIKDRSIRADGILSKEKMTLIMKTADCVPVIVYWPGGDWKAILHFGYKGLIFGLAENFLRTVNQQELNISKANFLLGPAICKKCYTHKTLLRKLKWRVLKFFQPKFAQTSNGQYEFDLMGATTHKLLEIGAKRSNIVSENSCTNCKFDVSRHYKMKDNVISTIG